MGDGSFNAWDFVETVWRWLSYGFFAAKLYFQDIFCTEWRFVDFKGVSRQDTGLLGEKRG